MRLLPASLLILLGLLPTVAVAQQPPDEPDEVRVTAESRPGFSPWASVRYTLWVRDGSATISVTRELAGEFGTTRQVGLISEDALRQALTSLQECAVDELPSQERVGRRRAKLVWAFSVERGGKTHSFVVGDPQLQPDRRYRRCLKTLEAVADGVLGEQPFRDTFFEPGTFGYLQVLSTPTARVFVDGVDMTAWTPIYGIRLGTGEHQVRFVNADAGLDRVYTVRIMDDVTTNLDVELW